MIYIWNFLQFNICTKKDFHYDSFFRKLKRSLVEIGNAGFSVMTNSDLGFKHALNPYGSFIRKMVSLKEKSNGRYQLNALS